MTTRRSGRQEQRADHTLAWRPREPPQFPGIKGEVAPALQGWTVTAKRGLSRLAAPAPEKEVRQGMAQGRPADQQRRRPTAQDLRRRGVLAGGIPCHPSGPSEVDIVPQILRSNTWNSRTYFETSRNGMICGKTSGSSPEFDPPQPFDSPPGVGSLMAGRGSSRMPRAEPRGTSPAGDPEIRAKLLLWDRKFDR